MSQIIQVRQAADAPLHLVWVINNICTNACSYCPSMLHAGKNHHYEWDNARQFLKILFDRYKRVHCSIVGGEPSVSPFLPELVQIFHKAGHTVAVGTNGAKPVSYWREVAPYVKSLSFSYHAEFVDAGFIEKVTEAGFLTQVGVRVMMHPAYWDQCVDMYEQIQKITHVECQLPVRIQDWGRGSDPSASVYTQEQLDWFEMIAASSSQKSPTFNAVESLHSTFVFDDGTEEPFAKPTRYINANQTRFFGYECEIGLRSLFVNFNGYIRRGNCMTGGGIGHLDQPDQIEWPYKPVLCDQQACICGVDVKINKRRL